MLIEELIQEFKEIEKYASSHQTCLRKAVGCSLGYVLDVRYGGGYFWRRTVQVHNGPSVKNNPCTNMIGNCGCSHSEPRAILEASGKNLNNQIMICTYSPCTNCANVMIDSGIVIGLFYDILTEHDKRGDKFLRQVIPVFTKQDLIKGNVSDDIFRKWAKLGRES